MNYFISSFQEIVCKDGTLCLQPVHKTNNTETDRNSQVPQYAPVKILFDESFYCDQSKGSYKVLCISQPLTVPYEPVCNSSLPSTSQPENQAKKSEVFFGDIFF